MDDAVTHADPIAHRRKLRDRRVLVTEAAAHFGRPIDVAGDPVLPALLFDHPRKTQIGSSERCHLCREKRIPPQTFT